MKIISIAILFLIFVFTNEKMNGQVLSVFDELESNQPGEGTIRIIQDTTIEAEFERFEWEQSKQRGIEGFRIRIFSDSGPDAKAGFEETKARFINFYDDIKVHESFVYPNYKLYIGDFRTQSEALKVLNTIERRFPDAFIVQTKINFPNLKFE